MFRKLAHEDIDAFLIKSANVLRNQAQTIARLEAELARRDRENHATKIANLAVNRGIFDVDEASNYAQSLANGERDLDVVEEFVTRAASGVPLGEPLKKVASDDLTLHPAGSPEDKFLGSLTEF